MDDELRSHIEMQTQENIEAGMNSAEARYAALRQFGWVESIKDTCRDQRGVSWIENLSQDIHYGAADAAQEPRLHRRKSRSQKRKLNCWEVWAVSMGRKQRWETIC